LLIDAEGFKNGGQGWSGTGDASLFSVISQKPSVNPAGHSSESQPVITSICAGQVHSALCDSSVVSQNGDAGEPTEDARKNIPGLAGTGAQ
jgi:hypothetical protein